MYSLASRRFCGKGTGGGRADVIQSAPSQAFTNLAKGETPTVIHFAQINEMDGFFITGRAPDPDFDWKKLEWSEVILFGGGQPLAKAQGLRAVVQSSPRGSGSDGRAVGGRTDRARGQV